MFKQEQGNIFSRVLHPSMVTDHTWSSYDKVNNEQTVPEDSRYVWTEKHDGNVETLVRFVQFLSDRTVTTQRVTALVTYSVHAVLLKVLDRRRK